MGVGFSARRGGVRASHPGAERGRYLHSGLFGLGGRHELRQPKSDASIGCHRGRARSAFGDALRERTRTDESAFSGVVCGTADRVGAHSAAQADAERAHREFPRTVAGGVFGGELAEACASIMHKATREVLRLPISKCDGLKTETSYVLRGKSYASTIIRASQPLDAARLRANAKN
jgi:hypothetical protein